MTRVPSQYDTEIKELEVSIGGLGQRLSELRQKRAVETCEFRVGDKMVNNRGQMGEVVSIRAGYANEPRFDVRLHKKDGQLGQRITLAYSFDGWKKLTEKEE